MYCLIVEVRSHQLPLFGHFCCRLAARPECVGGEAVSGVGGPLSAWAGAPPAWAQLTAFSLQLWRDRKALLTQQPSLQSVSVDKVSVNCLLIIGNPVVGSDYYILFKEINFSVF